MTVSVKNVLAVDFGTANSYFCKCPGEQLSPRGVDFGGGRDGLATAILYRPQFNQSKPPLVGQVALDEFGEATTQERSRYCLRINFKPDIANDDARRNAVVFLRRVLEEAQSQRLDIDPAERQVIFGVPSEATDEYRSAITEVACQAGYGSITLLEEPIGALRYHIYHKDLSAMDALRGVLVVDFGGGTCDFAFLRRGKVEHSWGDMGLGGRLLDDLFFQWLLDDNPGLLEVLKEEGTGYFVHSYLCREIKEFFSRTMTRDRTEHVSKAVRHYGRIQNMTWEAFERRATSYSPSDTLRDFLAQAGGDMCIPKDPPIDLIAWFRDCLTEGLESDEIDKSDVRHVILAGGSSQWPFVRDILQRELGIASERIMRSDRPYATISEGISLQPAMRKHIRQKQSELRAKLPRFRDKELKPLPGKVIVAEHWRIGRRKSSVKYQRSLHVSCSTNSSSPCWSTFASREAVLGL